ncbi:ammonium transporter, partial [Pseudomonas aeruginosa]
GGMVRAKNVLPIMMQCFAITGLSTILWVVYGYSLAFDTTGMEKGVLNFNSFVGGETAEEGLVQSADEGIE